MDSILVVFAVTTSESVSRPDHTSWYGDLNVQNKRCLDHIVKVAGKITGEQRMSSSRIFHRQVLQKARLGRQDKLDPLPSGQEVQGNRFKISFRHS